MVKLKKQTGSRFGKLRAREGTGGGRDRQHGQRPFERAGRLLRKNIEGKHETISSVLNEIAGEGRLKWCQ